MTFSVDSVLCDSGRELRRHKATFLSAPLEFNQHTIPRATFENLRIVILGIDIESPLLLYPIHRPLSLAV